MAFDNPMHNLSLTNGTIIESGANYAVITTTTGVLTGSKYTDSVTVEYLDNPDIGANEANQEVKFEVTLYGDDILTDLYNEVVNTGVASLKTSEDVALGDTITYELFGGTKTGVIVTQSYKIYTDTLVAEMEVQDVNN